MQVQTRGGVFGPGGYGGGVFDGSNNGFGSFEQAAAGVQGLGDWTWKGTADAEVSRLQKALNVELARRGYQPLAVDGRIGPRLCGAVAWAGSPKTLPPLDFTANPDLQLMGNLATAEGNVCQGYTFPTRVGASHPEDNNPLTTKHPLPWGTASDATSVIQRAVNDELGAIGFRQIAVTGVLDAPTCGAMRLIERETGMMYLTNNGGNCQAFQEPSRVQAPAQPVPEAPLPPAPVPTRKGGVSTAAMVGGVLAAAAVAGLVIASKKKKGH